MYRTWAFAFAPAEEYAAVRSDQVPGYRYSRIDNPTVDACARAVAALEGANLPRWPGAQAFAGLIGPLGMPVEVVSAEPGDAAAMKLLRSVFMKGLAAAVLESMAAAEAAGHAAWLEEQLAAVLAPLRRRPPERSAAPAVRVHRKEREALAAQLDHVAALAQLRQLRRLGGRERPEEVHPGRVRREIPAQRLDGPAAVVARVVVRVAGQGRDLQLPGRDQARGDIGQRERAPLRELGRGGPGGVPGQRCGGGAV